MPDPVKPLKWYLTQYGDDAAQFLVPGDNRDEAITRWLVDRHDRGFYDPERVRGPRGLLKSKIHATRLRFNDMTVCELPLEG